MRVALGLEYHGAAFQGWQTQPGGNTVQDHLEAALAKVADHAIDTICAGRTDAGVHATGQVVHFDTHVHRPLQAWVRATNRYLPSGIAVQWAREVDDSFHARFGALWRRYDYWLLNAPVRPALFDGRVGWVFRPLDVAAMAMAAQALVGTHDFSAFRSSQCQAKTAVRNLQRLVMTRHGRYVHVCFEANAFLHHMVRNLMGALIDVGAGRRPVTWVAEVLAGRDRRLASPTFGPQGLYLTAVHYDARFALPAPADGPWPGSAA